MDGGDVGFIKYENNILTLQLKGACAGCPSSSATLKDGIEVRFKELIPEIIVGFEENETIEVVIGQLLTEKKTDLGLGRELYRGKYR